VLEDDRLIYTANSIFLSFPKKVRVVDTNGKELVSLESAFTFIHPNFEINFPNGPNFSLESKSWIYGDFTLRVPEGTIEVHHQKGLRLDIFLNDEQIAQIVKNKLKFLKGDEYDVFANSDVSKVLLTAICLAWDMNSHSDNSSTVTYSVGNFGPVKRKGLDDWKPTI
jgi:uncharacterized protein YxjI